LAVSFAPAGFSNAFGSPTIVIFLPHVPLYLVGPNAGCTGAAALGDLQKQRVLLSSAAVLRRSQGV